ncbi:hypothetical protein DL768_006751 [Monosporascus sp. mg162]|nr:hypothetical protein DL768_006751 [Monosporascus sp. mg162]
MVRSLLTKIGPVEFWEVTLESTAKRFKAKARFLDETDARDAMSQLNGKELPFHKNGKLTVKMVYSAKFKVRSDIYNAVVSRVSTHVDAWKKKHVFLRAYPSSRMLKIEGESDTEVASSKAILDSILGGVVAKDDQRQQELGVVVVRNKAKQELRLFGTENKINEAQRQLANLFRIEASSAHAIELDPPKFDWAMCGGFNTITNRLGTEKAALDILSSPKKIIISSSLEDYDLALALVNGRELVDQPKSETASGAAVAEDCSVCWTEADSPVRTACDHVYCQDCFENGCAALSVSEADFVLSCHGDQGNCNRAISLKDMHKHLSSAVFEDALERSFASYVRRHPNELRFCPTPDCGYVYRVTRSAKTHTCSNCLQPTCSACHEPHVDMTCAEYKDIQSGGYAAFKKLKEETGIKDCPKCKTPIEKVAGCNHMKCIGCNVHICWVCMMTFSSGGPVYDHMSKMHGGHIDLDADVSAHAPAYHIHHYRSINFKSPSVNTKNHALDYSGECLIRKAVSNQESGV